MNENEKSPKKILKPKKTQNKQSSSKKKSKPESLEKYLSSFFENSFNCLKPKYKTLNIEMLKD